MRLALSQRILLITGLLVLGALVLVPVGIQLVNERERLQRSQDRETAFSRWRQADIVAYTMKITKDTCNYHIRFRNDTSLLNEVPQRCQYPPTNVESMFDLLASDGTIEQLCDTRGCPCESVTHVRGTYHPTIGYPTAIRVEVDLHPTWWTLDLWQHLWLVRELPPCSSRYVSQIKVVELLVNQ
jgi:hypothetical protein